MLSPLRRLHLAVIALFVLDGAVFGSWASRIPDVSTQVGADPAHLGSALFCISLGALISMQLTGALCARLGPGRVGAAGALLVSVVVVLPGLSGTLTQLGAALLVFGAVTGIVNVAANSLGVQLEEQLCRPVLSSLHAGFSFGGLGGALIGALVSGVLPVTLHLLLVGVAGLAVAGAIAPVLVRAPSVASVPAAISGPRPADGDDRPAPVRTPIPARTVVVLLGVIAGCTAFAEGSLTDWGALHLRETLHASPAVAAAGYAGFSLAMACGRLGGRRWIMRYGDTRLLVGGALIAAIGLLVASLTSSIVLALGGFGLVGLGLANIFPLAIAKAGLIGGARGVALASVVGYSGLLGGPPIIGFVAAGAGLPVALAGISALAVVAAALALVVDAELPDAATVASGLRAQARSRIEPAVVRAGAAARYRVADLLLLVHSQNPIDHPVGAISSVPAPRRPADAARRSTEADGPTAELVQPRTYPGFEFLVA